MIPRSPSPIPTVSRLFWVGEWLLLIGLLATLVWTTLCLGGFLAVTMVTTSWGVFGLTALGGLLWTQGRRGGVPATINVAVLLPVPFLFYALASVLWIAPAPWLAWREWLLWVQMWLVFALVLHFARGPRPTGVIVIVMVALGLVGVALAAYQRFADPGWLMLGRPQATQFYGRSAGMFGIPNSLAGLLELMIPACLVLVSSRAVQPVVKVACVWLAALFAFALVLTGSRGGWIGLGLALMIWPLLGGRDWRRRLTGAAVVLVTVASAMWLLYRFSENVRSRLEPFLNGELEASRPVIWRAALQIWREHPWGGSGAGSYNVVFEKFRARGFLNEPNWTHNEYLNTLSDYGVIGFALWLGAGVGLFWLGWWAVQRARRENTSTVSLFGLWKWRLGLLVGLLAFAFHLVVDFHTKIPALAFAASICAALLLRDDPPLFRLVAPGWSRGLGLGIAAVALLIAVRVASPLYRAEALRADARRMIDRYAGDGHGNIEEIAPAALAGLKQAVRIDPDDGQAWADLSYALALNWRNDRGDLVNLGRRSELAADRALELCAINAEFWVRKGVAVDMQSRLSEAEEYFRRALELAPNTPSWWYHYAYHLQALPGRQGDALAALETCLALDPGNSAGVALRQQLAARR